MKFNLKALLKKIRLSDLFNGFHVELVPMPMDPMCDMIYDFPNHTIWINTAADPDANITRYRPDKDLTE